MSTPIDEKSSIEEIRSRFDDDVERFSNLETGQSATMDAPLAMELITAAAIASTSEIRNVLDLGCGAGNNTVKLRERLGHDFDATLLDLSQPMLNRAVQRVEAVNAGKIETVCDDFRNVRWESASFDTILAAAVLHHLRDDADWEAAFSKLYQTIRPGGSLWITDLVAHDHSAVQQMMWARYGEYLVSLDGEDYRDRVFDYIDKEDSPRSVTYQLELLRSVGFDQIEILHKNSCFAAFGAIKSK